MYLCYLQALLVNSLVENVLRRFLKAMIQQGLLKKATHYLNNAFRRTFCWHFPFLITIVIYLVKRCLDNSD